jgi:hypothetical protein
MIQVFEHSDHIINNLPHWVTAKSPIRTKAFENRQHLDTTAAGVSVSCQSIMLPLDDCERKKMEYRIYEISPEYLSLLNH